jgi:hypothetical protein
MLLLFLFGFLFGNVKIYERGEFAVIDVNQPKRGDMKFILFHNDKVVVIDCQGGRCYEKIELESGKNTFRWKDSKGLLQQKSVLQKSGSNIINDNYTLEVYDCKNNKEITEGDLIINQESFKIINGKVTVNKWFGKEIKIKPQVNGYIDSEISKSVELGKIDEICLSPIPIHIRKCNDVNRAGKDVPESYIFNLGSIEKFILDYDTKSKKDKITIYQDGKVIFDTGCVGEAKRVEILKDKSISEIRVDVQPNCSGGEKTVWEFEIICPE